MRHLRIGWALVALLALACSGGGSAPPPGPLPEGAMVYGFEFPSPPGSMEAGTTASLDLVITNKSPQRWDAAALSATDQPLSASYHWFRSDGRRVAQEGARTRITSDVAAGGTVTVALKVVVPLQPGTYVLQPDLVQERVAWFSDVAPAQGAPLKIEVAAAGE